MEREIWYVVCWYRMTAKHMERERERYVYAYGGDVRQKMKRKRNVEEAV